MTRPSAPYLVDSASGTRLRLRVDGEPREVIDAMASWWCAIHGYAVHRLDAAARAQLDRMSHVMFGGLTHESAVELGWRLVELAPGNGGGPAASPQLAAGSAVLDKVFLADSGSVAVEVAMKMAWQAQPGRTRMFTIHGGYHGDTFSCMSVCDPDGGMHAMYGGLVPGHLFGPRPPAGLDADLTRWRSEVTALFEPCAHEIAAVILEPVLQGAGGQPDTALGAGRGDPAAAGWDPAAGRQGRDHRPPRRRGPRHRQDRGRPPAAHPGLLRPARRAHPPPHQPGSVSCRPGRARGRLVVCPPASTGAPGDRRGGADVVVIGPARP